MKKIDYKTNDGIDLNGILEQNGGDTCVVMCHGISTGKEENGVFTRLAELLNENSIDSFRFDFRGYEEKPIDFEVVTISGEIADLEATIDLIRSLRYRNIILLGSSFGGGIIPLLDYNKYTDIKGLIFLWPALVYEPIPYFCKENVAIALEKGYCEVKNGELRLTKKFMEETTIYKPYDRLLCNNLNKLFIHGSIDLIVPFENTFYCAKESKNSKMITIGHDSHSFSTEPEKFEGVFDDIVKWIEKLVEKIKVF